MIKQIGIGNTITVRWRVRHFNKEENQNIKMFLIDSRLNKQEIDYIVEDDNILVAIIEGKNQKYFGNYSLCLIKNYRELTQETIAKRYAFCLVCADRKTDINNEIELDNDFSIGVIGNVNERLNELESKLSDIDVTVDWDDIVNKPFGQRSYELILDVKSLEMDSYIGSASIGKEYYYIAKNSGMFLTQVWDTKATYRVEIGGDVYDNLVPNTVRGWLATDYGDEWNVMWLNSPFTIKSTNGSTSFQLSTWEDCNGLPFRIYKVNNGEIPTEMVYNLENRLTTIEDDIRVIKSRLNIY